jgi:hypothetical protein
MAFEEAIDRAIELAKLDAKQTRWSVISGRRA